MGKIGIIISASLGLTEINEITDLKFLGNYLAQNRFLIKVGF